MSTMALQRAHEPVGFGGSLVRQFGLLWTSRRPLLLLVGTAGLMALAGEPLGSNQVARMLSTWPALGVLAGPIWALVIFHNEGPTQRLYHWSQPVSRHVHAMARVAAGAGWLLAIYAVLVLLGLTFAAIDGNGWQLAGLPVASWVNFFTGPLIGYLGVSALAVASDYPFRWLFVILFLIPLVAALVFGWLNLEHIMRTAAQPVTNADWGLGAAIGGAFGPALVEAITAAADSRPMGPVSIPAFWWMATALWAAIFGGLATVLSTVHPDRMPRLR